MSKNKDYKTISSRDIQRNFSVLRDALAEDGTVYISYYNKPFAKVVLEDEYKKKHVYDKYEDISKIMSRAQEAFRDSLEPGDYRSPEDIYHDEMRKKYG